MVQLSHPYMTTGKTIALTRWTFVGKVMLFNMLSRLVITFLPRSKCLNFKAAVTICSDFGAQKIVLSVFPLFPHLFAMVMGPDAMILVFSILSFKPSFSFFSFTFIKKGRKGWHLKLIRALPVVNNLPSSAEDTGLIHGWGSKILHAAGQLSPCTATGEPVYCNYRSPPTTAATTEPMCCRTCSPQ